MKGEERCCIASSEREGAGGRLSIIFASQPGRQDPFSIDQLFDIKRRQKGALSRFRIGRLAWRNRLSQKTSDLPGILIEMYGDFESNKYQVA